MLISFDFFLFVICNDAILVDWYDRQMNEFVL